MTRRNEGELVRAHFRHGADYWNSVYADESDPAGTVYRQRLERALAYVDTLGIAPPARVADVGAGAGFASVALAAKGYRVTAVDSTRRMLDLTQEQAEKAGVIVELAEGDATALPLPSDSVDLVVALGLMPWVTDPAAVLAETGRILRPGGGLVLTADNRWRATELFDPWLSPLLSPLRRFVIQPLRRRQDRRPAAFEPRRHSLRAVERLLGDATFDLVEISTVGYSPVTFHRRPLQAQAVTWIEQFLSAGASKPVVRNAGVHVVAAAILRRKGPEA